MSIRITRKILYLCVANDKESMPQTDSNMNFDDLFRYNYRPLCLYAMHYIPDPDKVEDVVQECFAALPENQLRSMSHPAKSFLPEARKLKVWSWKRKWGRSFLTVCSRLA